MKTQLFRMSIFAVVMAAAVYAQNPQVEKLSIPFSFMVGSHAMPAGQYRVELDQPLLVLESSDGSVHTALTDSIQSLHAPALGKLVFVRFGAEYFLSEAWASGSTTGRQILLSRRQHQLARRAHQISIAVVAAR